MKKAIGLLSAFLMISFLLVGCGSAKQPAKPDYTTEQVEAALNKGDNVVGKTVSVKVETVVPNSAFGYNIEAGQHLNFVSSENPNVKTGDTIVVKVTKVQSALGSYIINY